MGKGKNLNPADKQRKKERQHEKKRNREDKTMLKEIVHLDPGAILEELKEIARKEGQGYIDHAQSKRKRTLMEMHKKATQRVKHEEKKARESTSAGAVGVAAAAVAAFAPPVPAAASAPVAGARAPVVFDFGAVIRPPVVGAMMGTPVAPYQHHPAAMKEEIPSGYSDYQQSIYRLKKLEQEEEREKAFKDLLDVQLRATEQARQEAVRVPEVVPYFATSDPLRPQKAVSLSSTGATKRKKMVETDALGNVVESKPAAAPPKNVTAKPIVSAASKGSALGMLGGYAVPQEDPYDLFLREINKV